MRRRLVALGADDGEAAELLHALGPSLMSVPRPAMLVAMVTRALAARLGDDLRLATARGSPSR